MQWLFTEAGAFNRDISNWDVSKVTNMIAMFKEANAFNQDISDWNVSSATMMTDMFQDIPASFRHQQRFNPPIILIIQTGPTIGENLSHWITQTSRQQ